MNWFTKLFGPKPLSQSDCDFFDACDAFATGGKIFQEAVSITGNGWKESQLIKMKELLPKLLFTKCCCQRKQKLFPEKELTPTKNLLKRN
jgi:hypothetical protein